MPPPLKRLSRPAPDMRTKLATATRWAAQRPRRDQQGIALQTVIVIVVMLVIAGGVSGVLLSRGGDVISDLESADVNASEIGTADECTTAARSLTGQTISAVLNSGTVSVLSNNTTPAVARWDSADSKCSVADNGVNASPGPRMTRFQCEQYRGTNGSRGVFTDSVAGTGNAGKGPLCVIG